jgi:hypothetical protein
MTAMVAQEPVMVVFNRVWQCYHRYDFWKLTVAVAPYLFDAKTVINRI